MSKWLSGKWEIGETEVNSVVLVDWEKVCPTFLPIIVFDFRAKKTFRNNIREYG